MVSLRHYIIECRDSILRRMSRNRAAVAEATDRTTLRIPEVMLQELTAIAKRNGRSTNAEILVRLERSLSSTDNPDVTAMRECFKEELAKALEQALAKK